MKTPMQELLEWIRATLPMDLDTPRLIEEKIESMLEKEKEVMCEFTADYTTLWEFQPLCGEIQSIQQYYNETFKTKER